MWAIKWSTETRWQLFGLRDHLDNHVSNDVVNGILMLAIMLPSESCLSGLFVQHRWQLFGLRDHVSNHVSADSISTHAVNENMSVMMRLMQDHWQTG